MAPPPAAARSLPPDDDDAADAPADPGWEDAWNSELDRRIADVREGRVECFTLEETMSDVRAALAEQRRARAAAR